MQSTRIQLIERIKKLKLKVDLQLKSQSLIFNQYDLLPNIDKYVKSNLPANAKQRQDDGLSLSQDEKRGLCEGLSAYYLYSKENKKGKEFFNRLSLVSQATWDAENRLDPVTEMELMKLTNHVRWLHARFGEGYPGYHPGELDKTIETIRQDNESPVVYEFAIASLFTEDEFLNTFNQCFHAPRMVLLSAAYHGMALYIEEDKYCFYDPDFKSGCEIEVETPEDLYAWLIYQSAGYDLSGLENNIPPYLELSMDFFRSQQMPKGNYPSPIDLIENFILKDKEYLQRVSKYKQNLLALNCVNYHPESVLRLLGETDILSTINNPDPNFGFTVLIFCCQEGRSNLVDALLKSGANPNQANRKTGTTPLQAAIDGGHLDAVNLLIQSGANINQPTKDGSLPLFLSVALGALDVVMPLFDEYKRQGGQIDTPDLNGETLLLTAIKSKNLQLINFLLQQGANIDLANVDGETPLNVAADHGDIEIIQLLINSGANINACSAHPILDAAFAGQLECIQYLIDDEKLKPPPEMINAALQKAIQVRQLPVASYLINHHKIIADGSALMHLLYENSKPEVFNFIQSAIQSGADVIKYEEFSEQSLASWALSNKKPKSKEEAACIKLILDKLETDPVSKFIAIATHKTNELKENLNKEAREDQNKSFNSFFLSKYYTSESDLANQKIICLSKMITALTHDPQKPILDIVREIEKKFPSFLSGYIIHPERDLVAWIEQGQNEVLLKKQYKMSPEAPAIPTNPIKPRH